MVAAVVLALMLILAPAICWAGGWYLLAPPMLGDDISVEAPLNRWELRSSYDPVAACEQGQLSLTENIAANRQAMASRGDLTEEWSGRFRAAALTLLYAKCIATDDPRLTQ